MSRNLDLLRRAEEGSRVLHRRVSSRDATGPRSERPEHVITPAATKSPSAHLSKSTELQLAALIETLFLHPASDATRVVGFCGVDVDAGASWISACTAELAARRLSGDLCLVDANFGDASLHNHFGVETQYGLADALVDKRSVSSSVHRVTNNFFLLSCGAPSADANGSIHADAIRSCLADLRATFEYVLINIGPLTSSRDALALSQCVDGIVIVLEANGTSRVRARESKATFERAGVNLLGAVLNNRDFPVPKAIDSIIKLLINSHS